MKFKKRLQEEQVPEWRKKYVAYKTLKQLLNGTAPTQDETEDDTTVQFLDNGEVKVMKRRRSSLSNMKISSMVSAEENVFKRVARMSSIVNKLQSNASVNSINEDGPSTSIADNESDYQPSTNSLNLKKNARLFRTVTNMASMFRSVNTELSQSTNSLLEPDRTSTENIPNPQNDAVKAQSSATSNGGGGGGGKFSKMSTRHLNVKVVPSACTAESIVEKLPIDSHNLPNIPETVTNTNTSSRAANNDEVISIRGEHADMKTPAFSSRVLAAHEGLEDVQAESPQTLQDTALFDTGLPAGNDSSRDSVETLRLDSDVDMTPQLLRRMPTDPDRAVSPSRHGLRNHFLKSPTTTVPPGAGASLTHSTSLSLHHSTSPPGGGSGAAVKRHHSSMTRSNVPACSSPTSQLCSPLDRVHRTDSNSSHRPVARNATSGSSFRRSFVNTFLSTPSFLSRSLSAAASATSPHPPPISEKRELTEAEKRERALMHWDMLRHNLHKVSAFSASLGDRRFNPHANGLSSSAVNWTALLSSIRKEDGSKFNSLSKLHTISVWQYDPPQTVTMRWWSEREGRWVKDLLSCPEALLSCGIPPGLENEEAEANFFHTLDAEINKANVFYIEQEGSLRDHTRELESQVTRLSEMKPKPADKVKILRVALKEHYRSLMMLQSFSVLNTTAVAKILKKHDKKRRWASLSCYMRFVEEMKIFHGSRIAENLLKECEELAVKLSPHGKGKARDMLKPSQRKQVEPGAILTLGFSAGMFVFFLLWTLSSLSDTLMKGWEAGAPGFLGCCLETPLVVALLPAWHCVLFGVDAFLWDRLRVNHIFIFSISYSGAPSATMVTLSGMVVLSLVGVSRFTANLFEDRAPEFLGLFLLVLFFMCALNLKEHTQGYMRYSAIALVRLVQAPFHQVVFQDFFTADQVLSQTLLLQKLVTLPCFLFGSVYEEEGDVGGIVGEDSPREEACKDCQAHIASRVAVYSVSLLPYFLRIFQCARRLRDEKYLRAHLSWFRRWEHVCNGVKYFTFITTAIFSIVYEEHNHDAFFGLMIIFQAFTFIMFLSWDLVVDWGLLRYHSKNFLLRDELILEDYKLIYFFAMFLNTALRMVWVLKLVPTNDDLDDSSYAVLFALLEIFRRCHWNFYRLENEHLNNVGMFRATKLIPLAFGKDDD